MTSQKFSPVLISAAATMALNSCGHAPEPQAQRPNVIILLTDDVGYGDLGFNGEPLVETPNADMLASQGLRMTNCHATSATSTPSRYGLLTGCYPWRREGTGIAAGNAGMIIPPEQTTIADMFSRAGYATAAIGKWHLGLGITAEQDWNGLITPNLTDIGFQYSYIMAATADRVPCVFIEDGRVVDLDASDPISVSYEKPFEGELIGREHPEMLRIHPSEGHDMAIVDSIPRIGYMIGGTSALWHDEDIADSITEHAVRYIQSHAGQPFFLYLGTNDIHVPRVPHSRFRGSSMGPRGDAIRQLDYTIGRIMQVLDETGLADNTLLILTSDNGPVVDDGYADRAVELLGSHRPWGPYSGGKYSIFEAGTRVPCIIRWPGHITPGTSDALISQIDL
ncbi:MAG: sulfatase-like hydrolase/transferase, partial [Paludibacteraceae bacterium]|nr:sulfatase-like hydrolase/transferase [Paludibacteraceae bacterium]